MKDALAVAGAIVAMGLVTFALRGLPFVAAKWLQKNSLVMRLGRFLPLAIMTLLLVHAMLGATKAPGQGPWPELVSVALVVAVQWRTRQALLSMLVGVGSNVLMRNGLI